MTPSRRRFWTPEEDAELLRLAAEGRTMQYCAAVLKRPRNSCCGRILRLRATKEGGNAKRETKAPITLPKVPGL